MAAKETTLKELGEMLTHVVERMASKEDLSELKRDLKGDIANVRKLMATKDDVRTIIADALTPIRSELKAIRRELDDLSEKVENVTGFRKEIDHALERIGVIEKHLGLERKIAA